MKTSRRRVGGAKEPGRPRWRTPAADTKRECFETDFMSSVGSAWSGLQGAADLDDEGVHSAWELTYTWRLKGPEGGVSNQAGPRAPRLRPRSDTQHP